MFDVTSSYLSSVYIEYLLVIKHAAVVLKELLILPSLLGRRCLGLAPMQVELHCCIQSAGELRPVKLHATA